MAVSPSFPALSAEEIAELDDLLADAEAACEEVEQFDGSSDFDWTGGWV